jgi:ectoine hydroxylase-related dioxygenase (phytanoyl-CoA dioxygenase family)
MTMTDSGFWIGKGILSHAECDDLSTVLARGRHARGRAGARHLMASPEVRSLAMDTRLLDIAAETLGGRAVPYRATLFEKSGRANWLVVWHQDTALPLVAKVVGDDWGPWSTKAGVLYAHAPAWALERIVALRVHLDPSTRDNGPLRVIPGTHRLGILSDDDVFSLARRTAEVECVVERGGIIAMRPLLIHSSSKVRLDQPRRVIHLEYVDTLDLGHGARLAVA